MSWAVLTPGKARRASDGLPTTSSPSPLLQVKSPCSSLERELGTTVACSRVESFSSLPSCWRTQINRPHTVMATRDHFTLSGGKISLHRPCLLIFSHLTLLRDPVQHTKPMSQACSYVLNLPPPIGGQMFGVCITLRGNHSLFRKVMRR